MTDVIVIGGGIAGMAAALNCLRGGKSVLLLEKESFGGQIANSPRVENYPSFKQISGLELADKIFDQISELGVEFDIDKVTGIVKNGEKDFTVKTEYSEHKCKAVIIACGVKHRKLNVAGEEKFTGKGVYYCAVCDGAFYKDQEVTLVGDANSALQYALLLSNYCSKVKMVTMFDRFFGDKALQDAVLARDNIEVIHGYVTEKVLGDEKFEGVLLKETKGENRLEIKNSALFVAIGQVSDNEVFSGVCKLDKDGFIVSGEECFSGTDGVFVAGDCRTKRIRSLCTASSDGIIAALSAVSYLDRK